MCQICKKMALFIFFDFGTSLWIYDIIMKNAYNRVKRKNY